MKETLFYLATGYILLILESVASGALSLQGINLDAVYALIVWFGVRTPMPQGLTATLLLGAMAEGMTALPPGFYIGAYTLAYLMVRYIVSNLMYVSLIHEVLLVLFVTLNGTVIIFAGGGRVDMVWPWGVAQMILNGITSILFIPIFEKLHNALISGDEEAQER